MAEQQLALVGGSCGLVQTSCTSCTAILLVLHRHLGGWWPCADILFVPHIEKIKEDVKRRHNNNVVPPKKFRKAKEKNVSVRIVGGRRNY